MENLANAIFLESSFQTGRKPWMSRIGWYMFERSRRLHTAFDKAVGFRIYCAPAKVA